MPQSANAEVRGGELQLKGLLKKRKQIKSQVTRFHTFVNNFDTTKSIVELTSRLETIVVLWPEFRDIQSEIEILEDDDESENKHLEEFENNYFQSTARAKEFISTNARLATPQTSNPEQTRANSNNVVKLPNIKLVEFDGKYENWMQFYDTFNLLINKDESLPSIQKFHYLKSALKGEAARLLDSIEVTDANYGVAWDMLKERYENKRAMVNTHIKSIFELKSIKQESYCGIRNLVDSLSRNLRSLKKLEALNVDNILVYMVINKLDAATKTKWEESLVNKEGFPTIDELSKFLNNRCFVLESLESDNSKPSYTYKKQSEKSFACTASNKTVCPFCKGEHTLHWCPEILKLNVDDRWAEIKKMRICANCFRDNHLNYKCRARGCKKCNRNHNTILHKDLTPIETIQKGVSNDLAVNSDTKLANTTNLDHNRPTTSTTMHCSQFNNYTLLSTVLLHVEDGNGGLVTCRALLDSGSQSNFICTELFNLLNIQSQRTNIAIAGINNRLTYLNSQITAKIRSRFDNFNIDTQFLILDKITDNIPSNYVNIAQLKIPNEINLADNNFNVPQKIDMLLGASIFWNLLSPGSMRLNLENISLQETKLGWIITGSIYQNANKTVSCVAVNRDVQMQLEKFWKIEECDGKRKLTPNEQICEDLFVKTFKRESNGRFCVKLPFAPNNLQLGNSVNNAIKRFNKLEKRLSNDPTLREDYKDFMLEYENLGHMKKLVHADEPYNQTYYLPHHCVFKTSSLTTKTRVVFDASAKTSSGHSLNDLLLVGPSIQDDLLAILLRFRTHNYVITADISKMYRQINIDSNQRDLQRIVWRDDPSKKLEHYVLNTLTYGTAPASFLATRCLKQLGIENADEMPEASQIILNDFYMDDLITGANKLESAIQIKKQVSEILGTAGFVLRKWVSNESNIFNDDISDIPQYFITDPDTKTLGILWNSTSDSFKYSIKLQEFNTNLTKRKILSVIAQIFDPLGLVGPVTIGAKLILQALWRLNLDWDDIVPFEIQLQWVKLKKLMDSVDRIEIPRQVTIKDFSSIEIHGFCDASMTAYGCCVYIKSVDTIGNCCARLLCAKSRVAPIKNISLPRLELCGAVLVAQLVHKISNSLRIKAKKINYWCDSTIVLSWIAADPNKWNVFVANRVSEIQTLTNPKQWKHVSSGENPADLISRGVTNLDSAQLKLWWSGPTWIVTDMYPNPNILLPVDVPEHRRSTTLCNKTHIDTSIFLRYSSLTRLKNVFTFMLRFIKNITTHKHNKLAGELKINESREAMQQLVKLTQLEFFDNEIGTLKSNKPLANSSKLISLNPFLDKSGILRVGGRLRHANINCEQKFPIILPSEHPFVTLIIEHQHIRNMHCGTEATLAAVRAQFWPLHGRSTVKRVLHACVTCARYQRTGIQPQMGELPAERVAPSRPFSNTGVDYAGPFLVKDGKLRNRKIVKAYLCVFVCFATKAVHLEVVGDLTTHSFLNSLKRFVARRGICRKIFSDNGSNFVGANRELKQLITLASDSEFKNYLKDNSIEWQFIPPRTPHFGGLWESAVKIAKLHLKKIVSNKALTFEEITTVFSQIEAILNSRPIIPLSNDPNDLTALTPGHFLIGDTLTAIPEEDAGLSKINIANHYKSLQQMVSHFWHRWSTEYLSTLQKRGKWCKPSNQNIKMGSMVLLKEINAPPLFWRLGRIVQLHPGPDKITRVVSVRTVSGVIKSSVAKLCVLPIDVE